jgi:hypothetical protein
VVEGTQTVGVEHRGATAVTPVTKARGFDLDNDLIVLEVQTDVLIALKAPSGTARPLVLGDSDQVREGEQIVVIGNPEGLEQTISSGLISGIRDVDGRKLFQISAPISGGSSGSPVFNQRGEVIGVVVSSIESGQNLNFAVPINYAKTLLTSSAETLISSLPRRSKAGSSTNGVQADLNDTLEWISNFVGEHGTWGKSKDDPEPLVENAFHVNPYNGCSLTATIALYERGQPGPGGPSAITMLLSDLDPARVRVDAPRIPGNPGRFDVRVETSDGYEKILVRNSVVNFSASDMSIFVTFSEEDATRFANAF